LRTHDSSSPIRRDNAELDVNSVSSDSDRLSRLGLEFDDIAADGGAEKDIDENSQGIVI